MWTKLSNLSDGEPPQPCPAPSLSPKAPGLKTAVRGPLSVTPTYGGLSATPTYGGVSATPTYGGLLVTLAYGRSYAFPSPRPPPARPDAAEFSQAQRNRHSAAIKQPA